MGATAQGGNGGYAINFDGGATTYTPGQTYTITLTGTTAYRVWTPRSLSPSSVANIMRNDSSRQTIDPYFLS